MDERNKKMGRIGDEDRISRLPTELLHLILSFLDTRLAVQTSILSHRWRRVWKSLPFLLFNGYDHHFNNREARFSRFIAHVFYMRYRGSEIRKLELYVKNGVAQSLVEQWIKYAIETNVEDLTVDLCHKYSLSIFCSTYLKKLKLGLRFCESHGVMESVSLWALPSLTTLHLIRPRNVPNHRLSKSCLMCLPALKTLSAVGFDLPESLRLPGLTTLCLARCNLNQTVMDFPDLLCLELDDVVFPKCLSEFLSLFANLRSLTLVFRKKNIQDYLISCPQLVNLEIRSNMTATSPLTGNIVVLAPKLRNFSSVGIFSVNCAISVLENVNIKLQGCFKDSTVIPLEKLEEYYQRFIFMFPGLSRANILTLDLQAIEALSAVSNFLAHFPSPFCNLKYVKLPQGYSVSSLCSTTKSYLLGCSPSATIVTTLPQINVILQTAQHAVAKEPLSAPTEKLGSQDILYNDTAEMSVQEEDMVENSGVRADRVTQVGTAMQGFGGSVPNSQVAGGACNNCVSSSSENSANGLWQGHMVNSEFVGLLDHIMKKYPETFEHFTTKSKMLCTMKLNMLCTSVNAFTKTSITEADSEVIAEYRALFVDLQRSFNVEWLVSRLNYIEQLQFSQHELHAIDSRIVDAKSKLDDLQTRVHDAESKLQDLQTLCVEKMTEIQKTFGTNLVGCYIGDGLLPDS